MRAVTTKSTTLAQPVSSLLPLLGLEGHTWNTSLCWGKDVAMLRSPKQARDWYYANQGGIKMYYFVTIQYCVHVEAQYITAAAPHSVFLMRLWWGSSCTHHEPICSWTKSYRTCVVFLATFAPRFLGAASHRKHHYTYVRSQWSFLCWNLVTRTFVT